MSTFLAIGLAPDSLRFVLGKAEKNGLLSVVEAGERPFRKADNEDDAPVTAVTEVAALVKELKAKSATLLMCVSRGMVDAVSFSVPPSNDSELPLIVQNMTQRQMVGLTEDSVIDFVAYPKSDDGTRHVTAMVLPQAEQQLLNEIVASAGCVSSRALVMTHPLRVMAPAPDGKDETATLVVSKGVKSAHVLVVQHELPVLSRTIRLAPGMKSSEEADYIATEIQRTLLSAGSQISMDIEVSSAVVVGSEVEAATLVNELTELFSDDVSRVSVRSLIDGEAGAAAVGTYAPLLAAMKQEASGTPPAVDFLNPRRPPTPVNQRNRMLALAAVVVLLVGGGWFYVNSQFAEIEERNSKLRERVNELNELVKKSRKKRNLAKSLRGWELSRMSWLDELRDITIRVPSSPVLSLKQFSGGPSGRGALVSFSGTSTTPEAIRQMEDNLRDKYHEPKIPGIREVKQGNKSSWTFQTTMPVKTRKKTAYLSHRPEEPEPAPDAKPATSKKESPSKAASEKTTSDTGKRDASEVKS